MQSLAHCQQGRTGLDLPESHNPTIQQRGSGDELRSGHRALSRREGHTGFAKRFLHNPAFGPHPAADRRADQVRARPPGHHGHGCPEEEMKLSLPRGIVTTALIAAAIVWTVTIGAMVRAVRRFEATPGREAVA